MKNPNSIILAVTDATTDFANSDSLKLASAIDKERKRTIGVSSRKENIICGSVYYCSLRMIKFFQSILYCNIFSIKYIKIFKFLPF